MTRHHAQPEKDPIGIRIAEILAKHPKAVADAWVATGCFVEQAALPEIHDNYLREAESFIELLIEGFRQPIYAHRNQSAKHDAQIQRRFPAAYHVRALQQLAQVIAGRWLPVWGAAPAIPKICEQFTAAVSCVPVNVRRNLSWPERVALLDRFAQRLAPLATPEAVIHAVLDETPKCTGALSAALWRYAAGRLAPCTAGPALPNLAEPLRRKLDDACADNRPVGITARELGAGWPADWSGDAVIVVPLTLPSTPLLLTVHFAGNELSSDNLALLTLLGHQVTSALALATARAGAGEQLAVLQPALHAMAVAGAGQKTNPLSFITALLRLADQLIAPAALGVIYIDDIQLEPMVVTDGPLAADIPPLMVLLQGLSTFEVLPDTGLLHDLPLDDPLPDSELPPYFALSSLNIGGKKRGILLALSTRPFAEVQLARFDMLAAELRAGLEAMVQARSNERLLIGLADFNFFSKDITKKFDQPDYIHTRLCRESSRVLNVPIALCGILRDDGTIPIIPGTTVGLSPEEEAALHFTEHNKVINTVLEKGIPVSSRQVDKRTAATAFPTLTAMGVVDWLCVPMNDEHNVRGVLLVSEYRPREFTHREGALCATYANQVALSIGISQLYEGISRQLKQMESLYSASRSIISTLDPETILPDLMQAANAALLTPVVMICLADDTGIQRVETVIGFDLADASVLSFAPGEEIIGMVLQRRVPITSSNLTRDGRSPKLREFARRHGLIASLTVPIEAHQQVLGTLTAMSRAPHEFLPTDGPLVEMLATYAAIAVHNARQYTQERRRSAQLRAAYEEMADRITLQFTITRQLLEILERGAPGEDDVRRTRLRLQCLAAMPVDLDAQHAQVELKGALQRLTERWGAPHGDPPYPRIHIKGAQLRLPAHTAAYMLLYLHEWLLALAVPSTAPATVSLALQQFSHEVVIDLDYPETAPTVQTLAGQAVWALALTALQGTMTQTTSDGQCRIRLRIDQNKHSMA